MIHQVFALESSLFCMSTFQFLWGALSIKMYLKNKDTIDLIEIAVFYIKQPNFLIKLLEKEVIGQFLKAIYWSTYW